MNTEPFQPFDQFHLQAVFNNSDVHDLDCELNFSRIKSGIYLIEVTYAQTCEYLDGEIVMTYVLSKEISAYDERDAEDKYWALNDNDRDMLSYSESDPEFNFYN
mgnify:CR=1 FL=1